MLHAGWRGLATGMIASGVQAMRELGADGRASAAIGPGAGPCCYEAGEEVHEPFAGDRRGARRPQPRSQGDRPPPTARARGSAHIADIGICTICSDPGSAVLPSPRPRDDRPPGGRGVVDLIHGLTGRDGGGQPGARLASAIAAAGRDPGEVEILAAVKYLPAEELAALADGGVTVVGENRAQELAAKARRRTGRVHLGLHRPAAEPQGQASSCRTSATSTRSHRLRAGPARAPRRP